MEECPDLCLINATILDNLQMTQDHALADGRVPKFRTESRQPKRNTANSFHDSIRLEGEVLQPPQFGAV